MKYQEVCQKIIEGSQEAIIFADREGIIQLWNAGAEATFGYRADEAIGQSLDVIIPEGLRSRHWEGYRQVMKTGVTSRPLAFSKSTASALRAPSSGQTSGQKL